VVPALLDQMGIARSSLESGVLQVLERHARVAEGRPRFGLTGLSEGSGGGDKHCRTVFRMSM